ncbi:E3 ubiquitin-protein ligase TRIM58-like [Mantella aurantiaca]
MTSDDLIDELSCSICLNIYTDPVTLRCGHNFCLVCIDRVLDFQEVSGLYTCPECRKEFQERPVPSKARKLRNIAEKFLISQPEQKESPEHVLSDPTNSSGNRKCSIHNKIMEYYCNKERVSICVYCIAFGEHKGHVVETLYEASEKKKEKLRKDLEIIASKKAWADKQAQSLQKRRENIQEKTAAVAKRITALFRDVKREIEEIEKRVLSEISKQEEQISNVIKQLQIQKDELSRKMSHIEDLCKATNPLTILTDQNSDGEGICHIKQEDNMDLMTQDGGDLHEGFIIDSLHKLSDIIKDMNIWIEHPADVFLDEETAANDIKISGDLKTAFSLAVALNRPKNPKRFKNNQVLSRRSFSSGRYNWEVDTSQSTSWRVGLCYPSMDRKSYIGTNKDSWCLRRCNDDYNNLHERKCLPFPIEPTSHKFRISLDYETGRISFYELSNPIRHIHTFTTTFIEPLYFVIAVWEGSMTITN